MDKPLMHRVSLAAIAASMLLLAGCSPTTLDDSPPVSSSASPDPVETMEPVDDADDEPDAPSDVLFTITAGTTDASGSPITLTMTGHAPQHWNAAGRESVKNDFITRCSALGGGSVWEIGAPLTDATLDAYGSTLMVIDVGGTPAGRSFEAIDLLAGSFYYQQVGSPELEAVTDFAGCTAGTRVASTTAGTVIVDYESGESDGDLAQWVTGSYGFSAVYGSSTTFTSCAVELTPLAATYPLGDVPGWDATVSTPTQCWIGYQGE
jgi:hypothetical protein